MELFFRKYGEAGPPLVIVHGLYGASDNWVSIARDLSDRFEVFVVDQRNHGQSPHSPQHDYPSMREDLRDFMDLHGIHLKDVTIQNDHVGPFARQKGPQFL